MARRFRRRRPRVVWLYPTGSPQSDIENGYEQPGVIAFNTAVTVGAGAQPTFEIPLVIDNDPTATAAGAPLTVIQKQGLNEALQYGYRLRRIVGAIHLAAISNNDQALPVFPAALITAGLMVRRVESDTGLAIAPGIDVNPALIQNFPDPWIWRRTWLLNAVPREVYEPAGGGFGGNDTTRAAYSRFPFTTDAYGDVRSGPHVDAKTARTVGPEERLFLDIGVLGIPLDAGPGAQEDMTIRAVIDLRVLASIRTNSGNRNNSNR